LCLVKKRLAQKILSVSAVVLNHVGRDAITIAGHKIIGYEN